MSPRRRARTFPRSRARAQLRRAAGAAHLRGHAGSSYWEVEDRQVYFGGVEAGPPTSRRLVVAEFAIVYSNDWFLLPVRFPAGQHRAVVELEVRNTFGESFDVRSTAQWDHEAGPAAAPGRSSS